jgi:hypothetical protein
LSAVSGACSHVELEQIKRPKRDRARQRITDVRRLFSADYCSPIPVRSVELHGGFAKPWRKSGAALRRRKEIAPSRQSAFLETKRFKGFYFQPEAPEPNYTPS